MSNDALPSSPFLQTYIVALIRSLKHRHYAPNDCPLCLPQLKASRMPNSIHVKRRANVARDPKIYMQASRKVVVSAAPSRRIHSAFTPEARTDFTRTRLVNGEEITGHRTWGRHVIIGQYTWFENGGRMCLHGCYVLKRMMDEVGCSRSRLALWAKSVLHLATCESLSKR
ncbi:hypothetical protein BDV97DRAFT_358133 [Delphinella strobiligena]|nr:hypothetical protein BDV97DRAFT_358133 [Delphinella strobiligena]